MSAEPASAGVTHRGRVPDFFIVGHHKSGTTALYEMLRRHPQIYMPQLKEPRFFCSDFRPALFQPTSRLPATLEDYLALFEDARPEQRAGEATPLYLLSRTAAGLIAEVQPAARIIAILREPADFLRSLHLQLVQNGAEDVRDLRTALELEDARREGRHIPSGNHRPHQLFYSDRVRYVEQLGRYDAVFAHEQMLVLIYDDYRADNEGIVRTVLRFLDVDDTVRIEPAEANPTVQVRPEMSRLVQSAALGRGPLSRTAKAAVKALTPRAMRRDLLRLAQRRIAQAPPPPADERLMLELRARFKGEVVALSEYLDRDLVSLWGYDDVG